MRLPPAQVLNWMIHQMLIIQNKSSIQHCSTFHISMQNYIWKLPSLKPTYPLKIGRNPKRKSSNHTCSIIFRCFCIFSFRGQTNHRVANPPTHRAKSLHHVAFGTFTDLAAFHQTPQRWSGRRVTITRVAELFEEEPHTGFVKTCF